MGNMKPTITAIIISTGLAFSISHASYAASKKSEVRQAVPADKFDLSHWKITVPLDEDGDKRADDIDVKKLKKFSHPDFFYLDDAGRMVFASPNKATTTANSTNTRSELRYMLRGKNKRIKTHSAANNFAVKARKDSDKFGAIGGKMEATLRVDHVSKNAGLPDKKPVYSVVVGQIHSIKYKGKPGSFGFGNEPLKIFYKKWPDHKTGSVFWTYERNLPRGNPDRRDLDYPVWGNSWHSKEDPGSKGIALGEDFSYTVNVHENTMYLTFENAAQGKIDFAINLANNIDANGNEDPLDNRYSYGGDHLYFKAGAYNQCSTKHDPGFFYGGCAGTGDWETDKANGDYVQASFSKLTVSNASPM